MKSIDLLTGDSIKTFGHSMYPLLHDGDVISIKKVAFSKLEVDDIVIVNNKSKYFTHRLIYKSAKCAVTKGDNNLKADGKIKPKQIIGRITKVKRGRRTIYPEQIYLIQSTLYFKEIVKIKHAFDKDGLDYVFLKGLPLHLHYEKTHPRRIYADCDVLISPAQYKLAATILHKNGYKKLDTSISKLQKWLKNKDSEVVFTKYINGFPVTFDLHLEVVFMMTQLGSLNALYPQRLINQLSTQFLAEKRVIKLKGESWPILSPVNLIVYLALHFFHHNYKGEFRLRLLAEIIAYEEKNQAELSKLVQATIKKYKLENFVSPAFSLVKKYYKVSFLPEYASVNCKTDIFSGEERIRAGINRFKNIFFCSPYPTVFKLKVFITPTVIYFLALLLFRRAQKLSSA